MSTSILKVKNPTTGEWEEIQAIVGPTGPAGPQGQEGPAGKNAYQYAQDKGYTGTEEEFATKLVESNEIFYVTMTPIKGQAYNFTSDKTAIEVIEAYNAGKVVKCKIDFNNFPLVLPLTFVKDNVVAYSGIGMGTAVWVVHSQNTGTLNSEDYVTIDDIPAAGIPTPAVAEVNQTIVVKSVDDNGKIVETEAVDLPSDQVFSVTATADALGNCTFDKTFVDVAAAVEAGLYVVCKYNNFILPICRTTNTQHVYGGSAGTQTLALIHASDDTGLLQEDTLALYRDLTPENVNAIPAPTTASVGQTIVVKAVDENGKIVETEVADLPTGGGDDVEGWEFINEVTITAEDEVWRLIIDEKADGTPFEYNEFMLYANNLAATSTSVGTIFVNQDSPYQNTYCVKIGNFFVTNAQSATITYLKNMRGCAKTAQAQWFYVMSTRASNGAAFIGRHPELNVDNTTLRSFGLQTSGETVYLSGTFTLYGR